MTPPARPAPRRSHAPASATLAALVLLLPAAARAQAPDTLDQGYWLRLGAFQPRITTQGRIDGSGGSTLGTELRFEDLGLARRKTLPTLLFGARLGEGWRLEGESFALRREGSRTLDGQIVVEDTTYQASARLDSRLESDVYRLSGGYSLLRSPQAELGLVAGLHVTRFRLWLQGTGATAGQPARQVTVEQRATVPLPTLGLYGSWAFAPGWQLHGRADWFELSRGQDDGRLINAQASVLVRFNRHLGLGLGWRYDDYRLATRRDSFSGRVEYRFQGPTAYLEAAL